MSVLHALHTVLIALFIITNIIMIPVSAMIGLTVGDITATTFGLDRTEQIIALVVGGFVGVGLINGLLTSVIVVVTKGRCFCSGCACMMTSSQGGKADSKVSSAGTKKATTALKPAPKTIPKTTGAKAKTNAPRGSVKKKTTKS